MSTQDLSVPISSLPLLLVQTQAARWKAAAPEQLTGAYLYLNIDKSGYLFHGFSNGLDARLEWYIHPRITQIDSHINVTKVSKWIRIDEYNWIRIEKYNYHEKGFGTGKYTIHHGLTQLCQLYARLPGHECFWSIHMNNLSIISIPLAYNVSFIFITSALCHRQIKMTPDTY